MADVLAQNLSGKAVMGRDGSELGMLYNITMDLKTGSLSHLLVEPGEGVSPDAVEFEADEQGRLRVPVTRVSAASDYIVVDR